MSTPNPSGPRTLDGRAARSARTRDAVVHALLALIEDGDPRPTAGRIAERAGISLRSVYVHFDDLDDLFIAASREQRSRVGPLVTELPSTGPFEARLAAFVAQRTRVLEAIAPVARAASLQEPFSPAIAATTTAARQLGRAEVTRVFASELAALDPVIRDRALDACDALTATDAWFFLRERRRLSVADAAATLATSLRLLLAPAAPAVTDSDEARVRRWRVRSAPPSDPGGQERR